MSYSRIVLLLALSFGPIFSVLAQKSPVLLRFDKKHFVTKEEFEYVYQKNNGGLEVAKKQTTADYQKYLDLYVTFKRKVLDAEAEGIDTTSAFKNELETYIKQLAQPYLIEKEELDRLIREAYDNLQSAVSVSHILIKVDESAAPEDTLKAYAKTTAILDSLKRNLKTFDALALAHSEDPSVSSNKGYLSYFTAFDFVYPFEKAAFTTPVGSLAGPIRTKFGYHILKVNDKIKTGGNREISHILIRYGGNYTAKDSIEGLQRANMIAKEIKGGKDFAELAKEYSDDPNTKARGGDLGTRYLPLPEMQDLKFKLKDGEVSAVFKSKVGYHLMKAKIVDGNKPFADMQKVLRNRVTRDKRADVAEDKLIAKLKKQYNFQAMPAAEAKFLQQAGADYATPAFKGQNLKKDVLDAPLFGFADQKYKGSDFMAFLENNRKKSTEKLPSEARFRSELDDFVKSKLLKHEEGQLENKYDEFRHLKKEYRDGILLFALTEKRVWRRAVEDTVGLKAFYEKTKNNYVAQERVRIREYRSTNREMMDKLDSLLTAKADAKTMDSLFMTQLFAVRQSKQILEKTNPKSTEAYRNPEGYHSPIQPEANNNFSLFQVEKFLPAGIKEFDEAKAELITKYQTQLETDWVAELAQKYPFKLDDKVFQSLYK
jgi:peptidyl-prolyl cis-trans isomerase SurA